MTFPPLPPPKLVLDSATPGGCKAEVTWLAGYIPRWYTRPKTVTRPSTNRARRALTSFTRRTPLTTTPRRQSSVRCLSVCLSVRAGKHAWKNRCVASIGTAWILSPGKPSVAMSKLGQRAFRPFCTRADTLVSAVTVDCK